MAAQVTGRVHSVESFGTVDGPGVRFVVFLQGCPMRCLYCHNPDTWDPGGGVPTTVEELLAQYARNEAFYRKGGITVTGGEPLLQIEFVTALFREAKRRGIHTCVDTSGATFRPEDAAALAQFDALCAVTDLVLLDIMWLCPALPTARQAGTRWGRFLRRCPTSGRWTCCPITRWGVPSTTRWASLIHWRVRPPQKPRLPPGRGM